MVKIPYWCYNCRLLQANWKATITIIKARRIASLQHLGMHIIPILQEYCCWPCTSLCTYAPCHKSPSQTWFLNITISSLYSNAIHSYQISVQQSTFREWWNLVYSIPRRIKNNNSVHKRESNAILVVPNKLSGECTLSIVLTLFLVTFFMFSCGSYYLFCLYNIMFSAKLWACIYVFIILISSRMFTGSMVLFAKDYFIWSVLY